MKIMSRDELEKEKKKLESYIKYFGEEAERHGTVEHGTGKILKGKIEENQGYIKIIDSHLAQSSQLSRAVEFLEELAKEERHNLKTTHINYMACNFCSHDETGHFEHCIKGKAQAFLKEVKGDETEE